jgi:hypothetical protein
LRLLNASAVARRVRLAWADANRSLRSVDLAGRDSASPCLEVDAATAGEIALGPWQIATLRIHSNTG